MGQGPPTVGRCSLGQEEISKVSIRHNREEFTLPLRASDGYPGFITCCLPLPISRLWVAYGFSRRHEPHRLKEQLLMSFVLKLRVQLKRRAVSRGSRCFKSRSEFRSSHTIDSTQRMGSPERRMGDRRVLPRGGYT